MILSALLGFAAPILPEVLKYVHRRQDNKHELELMKLRMEQSKSEHLYKMEEIETLAETKEMEVLHQRQHSFGIEMLDAAAKSDMWAFSKNTAFWMYCFLDMLNTAVRPTVTYWAFAMYCAVKYATWLEGGANIDAILSLWTQFDGELLTLVLSYWFGQRAVKHAIKNY